MNVTVVPEPSTIALLFTVVWLVASIVLLSKPRTRTAGIVVLAIPLALVVIGGVSWYWSAGVPRPARAWQPSHRSSRTVITSDLDRGTGRNVVVSRSTPMKRHGPFAASEGVAMPRVTPWSGAIRFILFAVVLLAGLVTTVALLAFPKTRVAGIALLVVGVPAAALLMVFLVRFISVEPRFDFVPTPVNVSAGHDNTQPILSRTAIETARVQIPDTSIPAEVTDKAEPGKPAARPPTAAVGAKGGARPRRRLRTRRRPSRRSLSPRRRRRSPRLRRNRPLGSTCRRSCSAIRTK